jgi:uncharacterized membrane protein YjfL (UPF0719 family)
MKPSALLAAILIFPSLALAADVPLTGGFKDVVNSLISFVDKSIIPLLFALAFIFFLIGMVRFFFSGSEENREKGRQFAIWGMVGLVVLFSIWGIVNVFVSALQ